MKYVELFITAMIKILTDRFLYKFKFQLNFKVFLALILFD